MQEVIWFVGFVFRGGGGGEKKKAGRAFMPSEGLTLGGIKWEERGLSRKNISEYITLPRKFWPDRRVVFKPELPVGGDPGLSGRVLAKDLCWGLPSRWR